MARRTRRPSPTAEVTLTPVSAACLACGNRLYSYYSNFRTLTSLTGVTRYTLRISRCRHRPRDLYPVIRLHSTTGPGEPSASRQRRPDTVADQLSSATGRPDPN